jgi:hypothetical protein
MQRLRHHRKRVEAIGKAKIASSSPIRRGQPKEAVSLTDTGGEMLYYSYAGHHYGFETDPQGNIISALHPR